MYASQDKFLCLESQSSRSVEWMMLEVLKYVAMGRLESEGVVWVFDRGNVERFTTTQGK